MRWPVVAMVACVVGLAGCSDPPPAGPAPLDEAEPSPTADAIPTAPTPLPVAVPFSWSGHTKEGAWVCMEQDGAGQCPAGQQVQPDGQYLGLVPYTGNLTSVELTMTWQPADPAQTGLVFAVYGNTTGGRTPLALAQGDSPLTLAVDGAAAGLVPDNALVLMVWPEGKTPTSPSLFVDATQQPFTVEGTVWQTG